MAQFRCLVVEDSPMMRQLIVFALHRLRELEVVEADDGVDAMRKLAHAEGIWSGPTGAVTMAALVKLVAAKKIDPEATVVSVVSETGLKGDYPPFPAEAKYFFAADLSASALLVFSQVNSGSLRPK